MVKIGKGAFNKATKAEQLRIARLEENSNDLGSILAQVMPHSRMKDLVDSQLLELIEVFFDWCPRSKLQA